MTAFDDPTDRRDLLRQTAVVISAVIAVLGLIVGAGAFGGTATQDASGGAFATTATLIAPAGPAFSIWSVIYLGLVGLAVWQAAPKRRCDPRLRATGWWVALTMLANAAWIVDVRAGWVWGSVVIILLLLGALIIVYVRLLGSSPTSTGERVLLDGTMGLYLGWVSIATAANIAAALAASGWERRTTAATLATVALIVILATVGFAVGVAGQGRWPFSIALAWGLIWLAVARSTGPVPDSAVAVAALVGAVVVLAGPLVPRVAALNRRTSAPANG